MQEKSTFDRPLSLKETRALAAKVQVEELRAAKLVVSYAEIAVDGKHRSVIKS